MSQENAPVAVEQLPEGIDAKTGQPLPLACGSVTAKPCAGTCNPCASRESYERENPYRLFDREDLKLPKMIAQSEIDTCLDRCAADIRAVVMKHGKVGARDTDSLDAIALRLRKLLNR